MLNTRIIILAAGQGKRMKSSLPKVLVPFMGKPMIKYVLDNSSDIGSKIVVVVGYKKELVIEELKDYNVNFIYQKQQLGTGHAVLMAQNEFKDYQGDILVLFGDSPLISREVIVNLIQFHKNNNYTASILTKDTDNPSGCARIIRNRSGTFVKSIENKDLILEEHKNTKEINVGVMIFNSKVLFETLKKVNNNNSQNEYYLPDVINILPNDVIGVHKSDNISEIFAFNTIEQLEKAEILYAKPKI